MKNKFELKNVTGFTLVEMLVVVAIIAILASVFLVGLRGFRGTAYDSRRLSDIQKVQGYLELYYNKNRAYPGTAATSDPTWTTFSSTLVSAGIGVAAIPKDPTGGQFYQYTPCDSNQGYILGAMLSDPNAKAITESATVDQTSCPTKLDCDKTKGWYCVKF